MKTRLLATILAPSAIMCAAPGTSLAATFDTNLIVNGDAETGDTSGFIVTGGFEALAYNSGGGYPGGSDPGVSEGGSYFFEGGFAGFSRGMQVIDVSSLAGSIGVGSVTYTLSALLGGYSSQDDNAILAIDFLDADSTIIGSAAIGPATAADRSDATALLLRNSNGAVPIGTQTINVMLDLTRLQGSANDGYADNLSLVLSEGLSPAAVPEPATWAMMMLGLGAIGGALRSRRRVSLSCT